MVHRFFLHAFALALCFAPVACDEEEGDTSNDSANDTGHDDHDDSHDDSHNDEGSGGGDSATTSSEQTCVSMHLCENDVCVCTTPGKEDESCTDDEACSDECEVCS